MFYKKIGSRTAEFTLVDYPTAERRTTRKCGAMDDRLSNEVLKSSDRLKQEIKCGRIIDFIRILYTVRFPSDAQKKIIRGGFICICFC